MPDGQVLCLRKQAAGYLCGLEEQTDFPKNRSVLVPDHNRVYDNLMEGLLMEAYCFKCRMKKEISNPEAVTLKNGRPATQGTCPVCRTKLFRIGKA